LYFRRLLGQIRDAIQANRPDVVVVCDSPSFNWHVAACAKGLGIRTIFYVAPQLWAWGQWRIGKLRRLCDLLCCILPFEQEWFEQRGVPAIFVGHPMLETLEDICANAKSYQDLRSCGPRIALMPGSRASEIMPLWPAMQQVATRIARAYPKALFTVVAVNDRWQAWLKANQIGQVRYDYSIDTVYKTAKASDIALVARGSATLEVAAGGCPMVVMHKANRIAWHLVGRWLVKTRYFSLVNLLAGRPVVREFVPYFSSPEPIAQHVLSLLADRAGLERVSRELVDLVLPLCQRKASLEVCKVLLEGLGRSQALLAR
jgi:lipid-A-disaccharide synthase